jgi:hypothetical protein
MSACDGDWKPDVKSAGSLQGATREKTIKLGNSRHCRTRLQRFACISTTKRARKPEVGAVRSVALLNTMGRAIAGERLRSDYV